MEAGTIQPNWKNLLKYSFEVATVKDVDLVDTWLQGQSDKEASDPLLNPFAIVTDHQKRQMTNTSGSASDNKKIPISFSRGENRTK